MCTLLAAGGCESDPPQYYLEYSDHIPLYRKQSCWLVTVLPSEARESVVSRKLPVRQET
jgi:hypothetical protein